jgi:FkbM family methyltransferase
MKWIKKLLQKALKEEQYLFLLAVMFRRLLKTGMLGSEYQDIYHLKNIIRPGDYCVDIGAHLGYYTFQLSKLVGGEGKVIAIEPVSKCQGVLEKIIHRKKYKNIVLHKVALGGKGEFVEIGIPRVNNQKKFGYARIRELSEWMEYEETEKVKNVSGNDLFANLPRLDFIKCDVEGAEVPVFTSMLQVLEKHKPICSCHSRIKFIFSRKEACTSLRWSLTSIQSRTTIISSRHAASRCPGQKPDLFFAGKAGFQQDYYECHRE